MPRGRILGNLRKSMNSAIIVAAGSGSRMQAAQPKQYLDLAGQPLLWYCLATVMTCPSVDEMVLVVPAGDLQRVRRDVVGRLDGRKPLALVPGGASRQESVYNGLMAVGSSCQCVVIHDGVRPFAAQELFTRCITEAQRWGACITGIPAFDTLKEVDSNRSIRRTIDRHQIWLAQTPQAFQYDLIRRAHAAALGQAATATDDAALVERLGEVVRVIPGNRSNIKVTDAEDLELARAMIRQQGMAG